MPRTIGAVVPTEQTDQVVREIAKIDGIASIAATRGASIMPSGDVLTVTGTNGAAREVLELLREIDLVDSVTTSTPASVVSSSAQQDLNDDTNEGLWGEIGELMRRDAQLGQNFLLLMGVSGAVAAVGLWGDTLHVVIAAMVIAPGFVPLLRIPFGPIVGSRAYGVRALKATIAGYASLVLAAAATFLLLVALTGDPGPLDDRRWVVYWSTTDAPAVVLSVAAAAAGALVVTAERAVLTIGVMIALALVPSSALVPIGLLAGDAGLAAAAGVRWLVDVALVIGVGASVLALKHRFVHREPALSFEQE